ncbi:NADPH:quinone reductase [Candidatus Acetothermia bacterium]|nr:NADPH:quinone reductase [Candidatus Acetothermia bacterium]
MKAIRVREFGGPEVMRLEEIADPQVGPGQVLVKVKAVGVNPVDTYIRSGTYSIKPNVPYTPGSDAAGVIESVGAGVTRVKAGDRVYIAGTITGSYAEKTLCNESQVHPLPPQIYFAQGAAINTPYATAYRALFQRAKAVAGETVFVHGASGGVGIAAVQLARAGGLRVIGTAGTEKGRALVMEQGAHHVLDHRVPDYLKQLMTLTEGHGVDVILEMLANVNLGKDLTILAHGGRVVVIGNRGTIEINPRDTMGRDAAILGMALFNVPERERASIHAALGAGLSNGTLRPVIGQELPLTDAPKAHKAVLEPGAYGKIVLVP